ncbi:MAG: hypothetical protein J0H06_10210 [Actinobacteria bacterium]|nr:hypothetical protein [Actinomycetota bacterium]
MAIAPGVEAAEPPLQPGGVIELIGSHGYKLLALFGPRRGKGSMELFVGKTGRDAFYKAEGEVSGERIDFDLGALGKFELERRPTGAMETIHACGRSQQEPGYEFVGTIEFHGEEAFTDVIATRAKMRWDALFGPECHFSGYGEVFGAGIPGVRIKARLKRGPKLQLHQDHPGAAVIYQAEIDQREGAVSVTRFVGGRLRGDALTFTPSLNSATFRGTGPFSGRGIYVEARPPQGTHPGRGDWGGNLTVDFPGAADVPLAGPGFTAGIIHAQYESVDQAR